MKRWITLFWVWRFENHAIAFEDKSLVVTCEFSLRIKKAPWLVLWGFLFGLVGFHFRPTTLTEKKGTE